MGPRSAEGTGKGRMGVPPEGLDHDLSAPNGGEAHEQDGVDLLEGRRFLYELRFCVGEPEGSGEVQKPLVLAHVFAPKGLACPGLEG